MPAVDELRDRIANAKYFSNIDLTKCYWQFAMHPNDIPKTAFTAGRGHWEFVKMPFGLRNAPATCQRGIDACFRGLPFVIAYMDDILIFSDNLEDHIKHLKEVFQRLRKYNLTANREKSHFGARAVKFLGHLVSTHGVQLHPDNLEAIKAMQPPQTKKELERFLGLGNYFAKFIPKFATIAEPLFTLKRNHARNYIWLPRHQEAFEAVKEALVHAPTLLTPVPKLPFILSTDASDVGLGASLEQEVDGIRRPVAFASRLLQPHELKRPVIDREALAIIWACDKFEPYLLGATFWIESDHEPLKWLYETPTVKGRLAHWQLRLASYDGLLGVRYIRGSKNVVADCLSRLTPAQGSGPSTTPAASGGHTPPANAEPAETIASIQGHPILPPELREAALRDAHGGKHGLHFGARRTTALIQRSATWPGIYRDVENFVARCSVCQQARHSKQPHQPLQATHDPQLPGHTQCMDMAGPLPATKAGNRFLLVVVDITSRFLFAYPMAASATPSLIRALLTHFQVAGYPAELVADNGRPFRSVQMAAFCSKYGINLRHVTPYRPQANGIAERAVRTIKEQLRAFALQFPDQVHNWDKHLPCLLAAYNTTAHRNTGQSPQHLWTADAPTVHLAAATSASRRHKDRQYQRVSQPAPPLHIGMQVYRRRLYTRSRDPGTALRPRWDGPFEIRAIKPPTTYILVDPRRPHRHTVVHRDLIRPAKANSPK
jgi:transposase InsO family protein